MTDPDESVAERYRRRSDHVAALVASIPDDRWDAPTPCADWDVRALVDHLVQSQSSFLGYVGRDVPPLPDGAVDPVGAWDGARAAVQTVLDDPAAAAAEFEGMGGTTTFERSVDRFASFDLVVHGWDLARATGQDETIPPGDVAWARGNAEALGPALHSPGVCGPPIDLGDDASEQDRLLAFLGRRP